MGTATLSLTDETSESIQRIDSPPPFSPSVLIPTPRLFSQIFRAVMKSGSIGFADGPLKKSCYSSSEQ